MPAWAKTLVVFIGVTIVIYVVLYVIPPKAPPPDECSLLAAGQQTATIDLQATVKDLDLVKAKVGVSAGQVQEVDTILKDFSFQYAAACRDHKANAISDAEYACKRDNMDQALATVRAMSITLGEVRNVADADAQKEIVLKDIEVVRQLSQAGFKTGCGSALTVRPDTLTFEGRVPERTIEVVNSGNRPSRYVITELPEAFVAVYGQGDLQAGGSAVVSIKRTAFSVVHDAAIVFYVGDNFDQHVPVHVSIDDENAQLYERLGADAVGQLPPGQAQPTLQDALAFVERNLPGVKDQASKYFFASGVLKAAGNIEAATTAIQKVAELDQHLYQEPTTQLMAGALAFRQRLLQQALEHFDYARNAAPANDERSQAVSTIFSAAVLRAQNKPGEASKRLKNTESMASVRRDPKFETMINKALGPS